MWIVHQSTVVCLNRFLPVWLACSVPSFLPVSVASERRGCCPEQTESASPARTHCCQPRTHKHTHTYHDTAGWAPTPPPRHTQQSRIYLQLLSGERRPRPLGWFWLAVLVGGQRSLQSQSCAFKKGTITTALTHISVVLLWNDTKTKQLWVWRANSGTAQVCVTKLHICSNKLLT